MPTLTSPPSGDENTYGASAYVVNFLVNVSGSIQGGPNSSYRYVTSIGDLSSYIYEFNSGLTDSTDPFYIHQYGSCGIASVGQIVSAVQAHEYASVPSHYSEIAESLNSNNPGVAAEAIVGPPSQAGLIQGNPNRAASAAYMAAVNAGNAEPPSNLPSNINHSPYSTCP